VGASRDGVESLRARLRGRYAIDHHRARLGAGAEAFGRARAAVRRWEMFNLGWVDLRWPSAPIEVGSTVGLLVRGLGLWSLNPCRIVYCIDDLEPVEPVEPVERFGFAYGTLPDHAARGEERFCVEWRREEDTVWYDLLAFSQPNRLYARLGYPYARYLQRRFAADSIRAMVCATRREANPE
jgi:uncharacterized protein (UPF0548 family)